MPPENVAPAPRTKFYLFVNGILTIPEDKNDWNARAVTWTESHYSQLAERYEYFSGALTRRIFQAARVKDCAELLGYYAGAHELIVVGHSNGADIAVRLVETTNYSFAELHLIAGATEADFEKNGLNEALLSGRVGHVFLYGSHNDDALRLAQWSNRLAFLGIGYGDLGLVGPKNLDPRIADRVTLTWRDDFGHGSWFQPANFPATIATVVTGAPYPAAPIVAVPAPVVRPAFLPSEQNSKR